jgi:diguanylate cyclase (GGDEF)-like protein
METLSQRSLGILRDSLTQWEPPNLNSTGAINNFWENELFDAGFAQTFIDIATSYNFRWNKIIPDLFIGRFGGQNSYTSDSFPPHLCELNLRRLLAFALASERDMPSADTLRQSLISDGFELTPKTKVDSSVPAELAQIPGEKALVSDVQQRLDRHELTSVLYIDLDGFKAVNDRLGHAKGDECLIRVAHRMTEAILSKGKLYRPHGDEFVVVLPNFTRDEAASTAQRIRLAVDADNTGDALRVTLSIGVVSSESGQSDAKALIDVADKVMYVAKEKKNFVAIGQ